MIINKLLFFIPCIIYQVININMEKYYFNDPFNISKLSSFCPDKHLIELDKNILTNNNPTLLLKEYILTLIKLNNNMKFNKLPCYKHNTEELLKQLITNIKTIPNIDPNCNILNIDILYRFIHKTYSIFPNLFQLYRTENPRTILLQSYSGLSRVNTFHSADNGVYESWVLKKLLSVDFSISKM